jgi:hypothetical protein
MATPYGKCFGTAKTRYPRAIQDQPQAILEPPLETSGSLLAMVAHRGSFVAYCRVSTAEQGRSGLGLEAQQAAVQNYLDGGTWKLVGEFTEVESGRKSERPALAKTLALCRGARREASRA